MLRKVRNLLVIVIASVLVFNLQTSYAIAVNGQGRGVELRAGGSEKNSDVLIREIPTNFNPLTASDEDLAYYLIPARPKDSKQLEKWKETFANIKWIKPQFESTGKFHNISKNNNATGTINSTTTTGDCWSGVVMQSYYDTVSGDWNVPSPSADSTHRVAANNDWVGIGGYGVNQLVQAGTESVMQTNGSKQINVWWEILGTSINVTQQNITNLTAAAGDIFDVVITLSKQSDNSVNADFFMLNSTTGYYTTFEKNFTNYGSLFTSAEWVLEHEVTTNGIYLNNFGTVYYDNCQCVDGNGTIWYPLDSSSNVVYLNLVKNGTTMDSTSKLTYSGDYDSYFNVVWKAYGPKY